MRPTISCSAYPMGTLPGMVTAQGRKTTVVLQDKIIEHDGYKLHYLASTRASASDWGYFIFIEGEGYDYDL